MVHASCLNLLREKETKARCELMALQSKLSYYEYELKRRERILFKIISIFKKPDIESIDIENEIPVVMNNISHSSKTLTAIQSRLESIYDYFLTYPPDWDKRRADVINRDGERCSVYEHWGHLHLHHITPLLRGGTNKTLNLKLLCEDCHSKEHGGSDFTGVFSNSETGYSKRISSIRFAIEQGKRVEFGYRKPGEKGFRKRTLRPIELVNIPYRRDNGATLCVLGFCELGKANRNFALKRMRNLKII